jgi:hypothetical protein
MMPRAGGDAVDGSQVLEYEFRHDDGRAGELPLGQVKKLFPPANSALGSSFETLCPVCLLRIFGHALRPDHVVKHKIYFQQWQSGLAALRFVKDLTSDSFIGWPRK